MPGESRCAADTALAILRVCPNCAGNGTEPHNGDWGDPDAQMVPCRRCDGLGDLLAALELRAYRAGRADALGEARWGLAQLVDILELPLPPHVTQRSLRARTGL